MSDSVKRVRLVADQGVDAEAKAENLRDAAKRVFRAFGAEADVYILVRPEGDIWSVVAEFDVTATEVLEPKRPV